MSGKFEKRAEKRKMRGNCSTEFTGRNVENTQKYAADETCGTRISRRDYEKLRNEFLVLRSRRSSAALACSIGETILTERITK